MAGIDCCCKRRWLLTHMTCAFVIKPLLPSADSAASLAKLSRMIPMKRLRMKKLATISNATKKNAMGGLLSRLGASSGDRESTPLYITAVQPSVVDISNNVCIARKMLSKFMSSDCHVRST